MIALRPAFATLAAVALLATPCRAMDGTVVRWPMVNTQGQAAHTFDPRSGLRLTIDSRWFEAGGYRPVRVLVEAKQGAASARNLTIELRMGDDNRRGEAGMVVRRDLTLPGGADAVEATLLCPSLEPSSFLTWSVAIDGQAQPGLGADTRTAAGQPEQALRVVEPVDGDPAAARRKAAQGWRDFLGPRSGMIGSRLGADRWPSRPMADWLGYSAADVVAVDLDWLRSTSETKPEQLAALRRWVLTGGALWVEGAGEGAEVYEEIDRLLGAGAWRFRATPEEREAEEDPPQAEKSPVVGTLDEAPTPQAKTDGRVRRETFVAIEGSPAWGLERAVVEEESGPDAPADQPAGSVTSRGWYAMRPLGFGRVLAFERRSLDVPARLRPEQVFMLQNAWVRRNWSQRHGLEPGGASTQFGNLLIPGVGVAPVGVFQVLITLFVLAIGPLNYWLLWRRQQLQLLVVTVPLGALAVTLALAGYAAVADGFGVKARVRSVTLLDQTTGEAASWSRVSHYAAMPPDEPATLPGDTAAYPILPAWEAAIAPAPPRRVLAWENDQQRLLSGWLPGRTAVQHLMVRSGPTDAELALATEGDRLRVSNRLGAPIELLVVRGPGDAWGKVEGLADGASATLDEVPRLEAMQAFRMLAIDSEPEFPIGAGRAVEQTLQRLGNARSARRMQRNFAEVSLDDNLGEQTIDRLSGMDGGRGLDLPPRSYVAVTREAVTTPLGWDTVREVGSFHVIAGRW